MKQIPKHLQEKIEQASQEMVEQCCKNEGHIWSEHRASFEEGAEEMHSLMLEELKPIVEKLENIERGFSLKEPRMDYGGYQMAQMASQALEIFKTRIEAQNVDTISKSEHSRVVQNV